MQVQGSAAARGKHAAAAAAAAQRSPPPLPPHPSPLTQRRQRLALGHQPLHPPMHQRQHQGGQLSTQGSPSHQPPHAAPACARRKRRRGLVTCATGARATAAVAHPPTLVCAPSRRARAPDWQHAPVLAARALWKDVDPLPSLQASLAGREGGRWEAHVGASTRPFAASLPPPSNQPPCTLPPPTPPPRPLAHLGHPHAGLRDARPPLHRQHLGSPEKGSQRGVLEAAVGGA